MWLSCQRNGKKIEEILFSFGHALGIMWHMKDEETSVLFPGTMMIFVLLLISSLCCSLHAQDFIPEGGFVTSETDNVTDRTLVLISAPWAIFSKSLYVFTSGIPIQPVYIQAPSGLSVWMTIQCRGGAARVTVPNFVANFSMVQTDPTGEWILPPLPGNESWPVTGMGIKFNQNVSICNDALGTLIYGKGADNDIAGKATMTITLNWNATSTSTNAIVILTASTTIYIWAPTALTNLSTFQATVAAVCLVGIFSLCCMGFLNSFGVEYVRRYNVSMARLTRDEQECEQSRVFNPLWIPCAPSRPGYYHIDCTPNSLILVQRHMEIKRLILRIPTAFSLMDRLTRVKYLKSSNSGCLGFALPCRSAPPRPQDSDSDYELPPRLRKRASRSRISRLMKADQLALARQRPRRSSRVRLSSQLLPPAVHAQQRAPSYVKQRAPSYVQQRSPSYDWQQAQAQAQAAMFYSQNPMYAGATNYPQQMPSMYPGYQYGTSQNPGAQGNGRSYETITVGYAFISHMLAERVPARALPSNEVPEHWQGKEIFRPGNYDNLSGAQAVHTDYKRGKEPMRLESSSLKQFREVDKCDRALCQHDAIDMVSWMTDTSNPKKAATATSSLVDTQSDRISLEPASNFRSHCCCQLDEVSVTDCEGSVGLEGCFSGLHQVVVPYQQELAVEKGSDRASECYGSPLSDIYEDVLRSCSPIDGVPRQFDAPFAGAFI